MNVEAQAIDVPTGVQDYRPALYGGVSAVELGVDGIRRVALPVAAPELEQRLVLAYTGASRNSGINNWEVTKRHIDGDREVQRRFARIRDIAGDMRDGARARRLGGGRPAHRRRMGEPQGARAWRDHAGDRRDARRGSGAPAPTAARSAAPAAAAACSVSASRTACPRSASAIAAAGGRLLDFRIETEGCASRPASPPEPDRAESASLENLAIARILAEIGDLLEIKGENPFKIRAYRNAAETIAHSAERIADLTAAERLAHPGHRQGSQREDRRAASRPAASPYHQELLQEFPPTILDLLHLQGVGPKTVALLYRELGIRTLDELERRRATAGCARSRAWAPKKEA